MLTRVRALRGSCEHILGIIDHIRKELMGPVFSQVFWWEDIPIASSIRPGANGANKMNCTVIGAATRVAHLTLQRCILTNEMDLPQLSHTQWSA